MSLPTFEAVTEALAPPLVGDPHDDDAQIIDDFFEPSSGPADPIGAKTNFDDHSLTPPKRPTRVQSGFQVIDANSAVFPIQVLPFDPNRERVVLRATSGTATDYVLVADEANKCTVVSTSSGQAGRLPVGFDMTWEGHNGPVYVGFGVGTSVVVSWWAITS